MYNSFFEIERAPFSVLPDPNCLLLTSQHADVISGMVFGVLDRKGYLVLSGEAGLGKTTAVRALLQLLSESNVQASVIFNPTLTPSEFLEMTLLNFGLRNIPDSKAQRLKLLEEFLLRGDSEGRVSTLVVDEAHQLSPALLEEIRLLGNFDSASHKLLQIVLVGQNELDERLDLPELWQLKQRITLRLSLQRLDRSSVEEYIAFRWDKAGGALPHPFSKAAIDVIAQWSKGIPRLVNLVCDNALLIAFGKVTRLVDEAIALEACAELKLPAPGGAVARRPPSSVAPLPRLAVANAGESPAVRPAPTSPPPRPRQAPSLNPSVEAPVAAAPAPAGEAAHNGWATSRPSLLKRWLRLSDSQKPSNTSSILSLKEPSR
jgi:general secretion pathway protein A